MRFKQLMWILCFLLILVVLALGLFYKFYFLRSPLREVPGDNQLFVSPANGKIIAIIKQDELKDGETQLYKKHYEVINDWTEGFNSGATLISIMMTPLDVHYQKAPLQATLLEEEHVEGRFLNAMKKDSEMHSTFQNEYNNLLFETPEKYRFRILQIAGFVARRIVDFLETGENVEQGDTIGLIKLGSQVSIILDEHFEVLAKTGDVVID